MWMKWHHNFSHGPGEVKWLELGGADNKAVLEDAEERVLELAEEYHWSDKYRGIDYELVEMPPPAVIESHLQRAEYQVRHYQTRVLELQELLKKATT